MPAGLTCPVQPHPDYPSTPTMAALHQLEPAAWHRSRRGDARQHLVRPTWESRLVSQLTSQLRDSLPRNDLTIPNLISTYQSAETALKSRPGHLSQPCPGRSARIDLWVFGALFWPPPKDLFASKLRFFNLEHLLAPPSLRKKKLGLDRRHVFPSRRRADACMHVLPRPDVSVSPIHPSILEPPPSPYA